MGEHQMNNCTIFSIKHSLENTALRMENAALLVTCVTNFESLKVAKKEQFVDQKCFKPVKALPHSCNMKKIALGCGFRAQCSTRQS